MKKIKDKKINRAIMLLDKIQKIRSKNNKNWMDILRLAFAAEPKKTAKIFSKIYKEDKLISKLARKLTK